MSEVYEFLEKVVKNWERISIRVFQDGMWQSLFLNEIKNDRTIADWITSKLADLGESERQIEP